MRGSGFESRAPHIRTVKCARFDDPQVPTLLSSVGETGATKGTAGLYLQILSGLPCVPSSSSLRVGRWAARGQKRSHTMSQNRECLDECAACMLKGVSPGMGPCCRLAGLSLELWNWPQSPDQRPNSCLIGMFHSGLLCCSGSGLQLRWLRK